jgi:hypothetical protein
MFFCFDTVVSIVVPDADVVDACSLVNGSDRFRVLPETTVVPELKTSQVSGWWKQQAIKLAFATCCETDFYLTLDSDCMAVRRITYGDLVVDGRGIVQYEPLQSHESWYAASSIVLQMGLPPGDMVGVTPFLMSRDVARQLYLHLSSIDRGLGMFLVEPKGCTEYSLYHIFGYNTDLFAKYHCASNVKLYGNCIWWPSEIETWNAADSFVSPDFFFSVLQSNTGIAPEWIWQRIGEYVQSRGKGRCSNQQPMQ